MNDLYYYSLAINWFVKQGIAFTPLDAELVGIEFDMNADFLRRVKEKPELYLGDFCVELGKKLERGND